MTKTPTWIVDHADLCTAEDPVPCTLACPLGLDVHTMMSRLSKGDLEGARMQIEQDLPFPGIVCHLCPQPCRPACKRAQRGGSINIRELERACLQHAQAPAARRYARRRKDDHILVVGGGIAGMTCAYVLGRRGHDVELHCADAQLGGWLLQLVRDGAVPAQALQQAVQSVEENARVVLDSALWDIDDAADGARWDACIVATGREAAPRAARCFGLATDAQGLLVADPITWQTTREAVFAAGGAVGQTDVVGAMAQALSVCISVERSVRGGSLTIDRDDVRQGCSRLFVDLEGVDDEPPIDVPEGGYSRDEAIAEAQRCLLCECDRCVRTCDLMSRDNRKPVRCINDLGETFAAVAKHTPKIALRKSNMCLQCNLCGQRCPNGLDMGELYLETRRILRQRGELPPAFHDFWLRDMDHALGQAAACTVLPDGTLLAPGGEPAEAPCPPATVRYLFFPGCSLGASDPSLVTGGYGLLQQALGAGHVGIDVGCCGAPAHWAGDEALFDAVNQGFEERWQALGRPEVVVACSTCRKMLKLAHPDLPLHTLWEVLAQTGLPDTARDGTGQALSLFDPCSSRTDPQTRAAVRALLDQMGFDIEQISGDASKAPCCGFGGLTYAVDPQFARSVSQKRIDQAHHRIVTYCSNCRDVFSARYRAQHDGRCERPYHLIDLLLGHAQPAAQPSLGQRRRNRELLRQQLTGVAAPGHHHDIEIVLDEGVLEKLDEQLVLVDEVRQAVEHALETGERLLDPQTGWLITHLQVGLITLWVVYEPEAPGQCGRDEAGGHDGDSRVFRIHNVYSHRMALM